MIVVLASRFDSAAADLVRRWAGHDAQLLTCESLSGPGWRWESDRPDLTTLELGGEIVPIDRVRAVLSLLSYVDPSELPHIVEEERDYIAGELMAFLVAWLTSLPIPVVNPATPLCLTGPRLHHEQWLQAGLRAGLPIYPSHRATTRYLHTVAAGQIAEDLRVPVTANTNVVTVPVVGGRVLGPVLAASETMSSGLSQLAGAVGARLMTATFFINDEGRPEFAGAIPTVDVSRPDVIDALSSELGLAS